MIAESPAHAVIDIGDTRWRLYVFGVSRVGPDLFIQVAMIGPRIRTATVRARAPIGNRATAHRVLTAVRDWMIRGSGDEDHAFLELCAPQEVAC